jgi:hypothetical protein
MIDNIIENIYFINNENETNDKSEKNKDNIINDDNLESILNNFLPNNKKKYKIDVETEKIIETLIMEDNTRLDLSNLCLMGSFDLRYFGNLLIKVKDIDCSNNYFTEIIVSDIETIEKFIFDPNPIKIIKFPYKFDSRIDNLPDTTSQILFCQKKSLFNHEIDDLPSSLEYLQTGLSFNKSIDNLPIGLKYLSLGYYFNQKINKLPLNLSALYFEHDSIFNQEINLLPNNLKILKLPFNLTYLNFNLPIELKFLYLTSVQKREIIKNLPDIPKIKFNTYLYY